MHNTLYNASEFGDQKVNNMASSLSTLCILSVQFNGAFEACLMSTNSSLKKPFPYFPCFCLSDAIKCGLGWAVRPPAAGWCNELVLSTASGLIFTMFCPGHWASGPSLSSINNTSSVPSSLSAQWNEGFYSRGTQIMKPNPLSASIFPNGFSHQ